MGRFKLTRIDFAVMKEDEYVDTNIIDVWTAYLNENERFRSPSSPLRFFVSSFPVVCL
jgi:hypothetical protein